VGINVLPTDQNIVASCFERVEIASNSDTKVEERILNDEREAILSITKDRIIKEGQGEYLVYSEKGKKISRKQYSEIHKILNELHPTGILQKEPTCSNEDLSNRYEIIKERIKKLDSSYSIAFVPKILYEMTFIRQCIEEELEPGRMCERHKKIRLGQLDQKTEESKKNLKKVAAKRCWHMMHNSDGNGNNSLMFEQLAYRLNKVMIESLHPQSEGFSFEELSKQTIKEFNWLNNYHKNKEMDKLYHLVRDFTTCLSASHPFQSSLPRQILALECSDIAKDSFLLYRGSDFDTDSVKTDDWKTKKCVPYSLSYGTGLYAGAMYDHGATAMHYMRQGYRSKSSTLGYHGHALVLPFAKAQESPFKVPLGRTIPQLFGSGEAFHGRTVTWKGFKGECHGAQSRSMPNLVTEIKRDELIKQFDWYKKHMTIFVTVNETSKTILADTTADSKE